MELAGSIVTMDWVDRARCRGLDPDQFFVRGAAQGRKVARICGECPVRDTCLEYALANQIEFGIWGGTTERQRRALVRQRMALQVA